MDLKHQIEYYQQHPQDAQTVLTIQSEFIRELNQIAQTGIPSSTFEKAFQEWLAIPHIQLASSIELYLSFRLLKYSHQETLEIVSEEMAHYDEFLARGFKHPRINLIMAQFEDGTPLHIVSVMASYSPERDSESLSLAYQAVLKKPNQPSPQDWKILGGDHPNSVPCGS